MASPATSWTGSAVVNGLMAIVLLAWLADVPTRGSVPRPPTKPAEVEPSIKAPAPRIEKPTSINLPAPPPQPVSRVSHDDAPVVAPTSAAGAIRSVKPMRPSTHRESKQPITIVALRPREVERREANPPNPTPPRLVEETTPAPDPVAPSTVSEVETNNFAKARAKAKAEAAAKVEVNAQAVRNGRQLLRILEHGEGPAIEIAWPGSSARRERLHGVLQRCHGMRLALIDDAGGLYLDDGPRGSTWHVDLDRFSGFVRRPNGHITSAERRDAGRVARYHHGLPAAEPVRLFPRAADAVLLGGLALLLGDDYRAAKTITASYRLRGSRVTVGDLRIDGRRVAGRIDLSRGALAACRGTGRS